MKDITAKICEGKANPEFDKIYTLIKSIKDWYNYGVKQARKNNGMNSPYIKSFTSGVEKFIKTSIIDSLEYMDEDVTINLAKTLSLNINDGDGFDKIGDELVKYIIKK